MIKIATAINSFASVAQQANVSPEEPIFVLTSTQLQEILAEATKSLNSKIDALEERIAVFERDKAKFEALEKNLDVLSENQFIQLKLIADLRKEQEPQPLQKDRGDILRALLAANGGKMLAKDVRKKMRLDKVLFSQLLTKVEDIEIRPYKLDKRQKLLVLR